MTALPEAALAQPPLVRVLISTVLPATMSRINTSLALLVSPETKSPAVLSNRAKRPSDERPAGSESPLPPLVPARLTLTNVVAPLLRSRRYTLIRARLAGKNGVLLAVMARLLAELANRT